MTRWSVTLAAMTLATSLGVAPAHGRTEEREGSGAKEKAVAVRLSPRVAFGPVNVRALVQVRPSVPPGSYIFTAIVYGPGGTRDQVIRREYAIHAPGAP